SELSMAVAGRGGERLAQHGVGVVLVPAQTAPGAELRRGEVVAALDATPGIVRVGETDAGTVWRVSTDAGSGAGAQGAPGAEGAEASAGTSASAGAEAAASSMHRITVRESDGTLTQEIPSQRVGAAASIERGAPHRLLVLTERADPHWLLTVDGSRAPAANHGWQQAFALPEAGGEAVLSYEPPGRLAWSIAQALILGATALLAIPVRRRQEVA
ncbi:MAG: hypothetical protein Q4G64_07325, partial [bacterium]|nr:hypothetical protein [bacterium]